MRKESILKSLVGITTLSAISAGVLLFILFERWLIGFLFLALGFLHLAAIRFSGRTIASVWPDLVFGMIDNGLLVIGALIGADLAGITGAIVGGAAANAITDGFAGLFEGWSAEYLRKRRIKEERTALSSSLGKMAGCFFGAGLVFLIAWTFLSI